MRTGFPLGKGRKYKYKNATGNPEDQCCPEPWVFVDEARASVKDTDWRLTRLGGTCGHTIHLGGANHWAWLSPETEHSPGSNLTLAILIPSLRGSLESWALSITCGKCSGKTKSNPSAPCRSVKVRRYSFG